MPDHITKTVQTAPSSGATTAARDGDHPADHPDLLRCRREGIDTAHHQLDPLKAKHGYDINDLPLALDRYTALLRGSDNRFVDEASF